MDERDLEPEQPEPGLLVDQLDAVRLQPLELRAPTSVDLERDVVQARPAPGEEPPDRRLGAQRAQKLDP